MDDVGKSVCGELGARVDAHERGIAEGRRLDRRAVVEWLRERSVACPDQDWPESTRDELDRIADAIERGEHLK